MTIKAYTCDYCGQDSEDAYGTETVAIHQDSKVLVSLYLHASYPDGTVYYHLCHSCAVEVMEKALGNFKAKVAQE